MPENAQLFDNAVQYPGLFFIDAHQQSSGYFFPPNEDAALHEISHFALDLINDVIGPSIQNGFNDQSSQYRNYNTYDLFVPEYGDTVPALLMGSAGMTYEKGNNENYGKQVYDHYLAIDETVNEVAAEKTQLMTELGQAVAGGRRPGLGLQAPGQHAGEPGGDRPARHRPGARGPEPEHGRVRLLLPPERALG